MTEDDYSELLNFERSDRYDERQKAALLEMQARASGLELVSENADIDEGLEAREVARAGG